MKFPIPILLYHAFGNQSSSSIGGLDLFSSHLDWLSHNGWRSLTLTEYEAACAGSHDAGSRRFLITFDDNSPLLGQYASEMKVRGFSGTAFLITGKFEFPEAGWLSFDAAAELVRNGTSLRLPLGILGHEHGARLWTLMQEPAAYKKDQALRWHFLSLTTASENPAQGDDRRPCADHHTHRKRDARRPRAGPSP